MNHKQWRRLLEQLASEFDASVDFGRPGHPRIDLPNGRSIGVPRTPSKPEQSIKNARTRLKRKSSPMKKPTAKAGDTTSEAV